MKKEEKDEIILAALISNPTTKAAAEACGVSQTQIYERLKDPFFKRRYDEARLAMLEECTANMQKRIGAAIEGLANIADDITAPAQTRLNAYTAIIRESIRLTDQVEILKRIQQLEDKTTND